MSGPNLALYRHLATLAPGLDVQASGGVKSLSDVTDLSVQGVAGIILGRSLLEGAFALPEAIATAEKANATC